MLKKPSQKTITDAGITAVAFVAGAKVGDGIAAVMPDSVAAYKKWGLAAVGIVLAASISGTTTTAKAAQSASLVMAAKQLCDAVTEQLTVAVPKKTGTTAMDKFINAIVGHEQKPIALGAAWDSGVDSQVWDRPLIEASQLAGGFDPSMMM